MTTCFDVLGNDGHDITVNRGVRPVSGLSVYMLSSDMPSALVFKRLDGFSEGKSEWLPRMDSNHE